MTNKISESQKVTEELLTYLSEFFRQTNPNPFVAIAAIEIYKNQLFAEDIFDLVAKDTYVHIKEIHINDTEIEEFLLLLIEFVDESIRKIAEKPAIFLYPPATYIVTALEIAKYHFLEKVTKRK